MSIGNEAPEDHEALGLTEARLLEMHRLLVLARRLDDRMWALRSEGKVPFAVCSAGHEAVGVGAAFALDPETDWAVPYYRDLPFMLAVGLTPEEAFLNLFAKEGDPAGGGRQLPYHWSLPRRRVFSHSPLIGTQFPHAAGIAYELKRSGRPGVVLVTGGEASTSQGDLHEALNFSAFHQLPVVFLIPNDKYATTTPARYQVAGNLAERARAYDMDAVAVDGSDVLAVYRQVAWAAERARAGEGPTLIDAHLHRYYAHSSGPDTPQHTAEQVEEWKRHDPVARMRAYLVERRLLPDTTEEAIDEEASALVSSAADAAEQAPEPADAFALVYARPVVNTLPAEALEADPAGPEMSLVAAINQALLEIMADHPEVVVLGEQVVFRGDGVSRATSGLADAYGPARCFNVPWAESSTVGTAIGMAAAGGRPIVEIYAADFLHAAFNQIVSEAARLHYRSAGGWTCPLVIRSPFGGAGEGPYSSQSVEAFYAHVPGLKVVVPSTPADAKGLLRAAVEDPDPVLFLEPRRLYHLASGPVPGGPYRVPLGRAALRRAGDDLTIITYGTMAHFAAQAADLLAERGVGAEVLDLRTLRPLDWVSVETAVRRSGKVLIVHEDNEFGGFGAEVAAEIGERAFEWLDAPVQRYATPDVPAFPFAPSLAAQVMPSVEGIVARAADLAAF